MIKNTILRPAIEVIQNKENYKVKVQLPGIKKDNIEVELDNDFMTICAQTHEEKEEEKQEENNKRYHTSEFRYGKYQRTISFDQPIKIDEAEAQYKDGVLTITIPKQNIETKEPKKLEIKEK
jgi:HSP20 family protein